MTITLKGKPWCDDNIATLRSRGHGFKSWKQPPIMDVRMHMSTLPRPAKWEPHTLYHPNDYNPHSS